jgi:O-acetylhomoserine (thiol)-lyase
MPGHSDPGFDTLSLHAGSAPDPATGARAVPIYLSTSFVFESSDHAAALFNMERSGHVYSRISNPTTADLALSVGVFLLIWRVTIRTARRTSGDNQK